MPDLRAAVERARLEGTRVVLLTSGGSDAERVAAFLGDQGLVTYSGPVGPSGPSWMGFWFFGRKHALLAGLPSDCVLDWPYQITAGNGLMLSGSGLETVVGYGKNHDPNVGVAAAVVPCGRGRLVLLALPGLMDAFINSDSGRFQPVTAKRLIFNALNQ
jgi:beta-galactosidase